MAIGKLIKKQKINDPSSIFYQFFFMKRKEEDYSTEALWTLLNPENNQILLDGVSTSFLLSEIKNGRIIIEDDFPPEDEPDHSST